MSDVAVLLANEARRIHVAQVLTAQHAVVFDLAPPSTVAGAAADVDLVIVDGPSLIENAARIETERRRRGSVPLPVLLLSDHRGVTMLTDEAWRIVDDVVLRPLEKIEMQLQVELLLRPPQRAGSAKPVASEYAPERRAAQRFQEAALPRSLPRVPGLTFGAFYRSGLDEARAGGDWYDALQLLDGRVLLSIGDVCGSGLDAAVAMASVRQVFRGAAQIDPDPAVLLHAAHRTLRAENQDALVTAFVGVFDPITSLLTYASAGHPRPLVRETDGTVFELPSSGGPLGLPFDVERPINLTTLPVGSLLVLYTDGLTQAQRDPIAGEIELRRAVENDAVRSAPNVALAIYDAIIGSVAPDDVAILTVARIERDDAGERLLHWSFDARDVRAAKDVRRELVDELRRINVTEAALANSELVFSELIGNVVRYAARWVDVVLDASGASPVLHILDSGPGFRYLPRFAVDVLSESGRGLFIVAQLTDEFHVSRRPHGGSHARAVLSRSA